MFSRLSYLLIICALLLSNCAQNDVVVPGLDDPKPREVPISFEGSYVDNATTRSANNLCAHLNTMGVWGWCNGMHDKNTLVFNDQPVTYNADSTRWEYTPLQYWREGCHYAFCAYAPHQAQTDAEVNIDAASRMISIKNVTLHGHNLQQVPTDSAKELFLNTPDTDWMIARSGQTATGAAGMSVEFSMQHILSKLNIRIKGCAALLDCPHIKAITADSIVVGALPAQGNFVQQLTHTPILGKTNTDNTEEWTTHSPHLYIKGTQKGNVTVLPTYLVESLVLPHSTSSASTITLYYSYHYADGQTEECRYRMPLTEAFTRFVSGYCHTLTFTICSDRITFEAGARGWEEK